MPALASLSQEDLDALAAEQAAQDAAAAAAAAPPPDPAAAAPVPPPADAGAAYGMGVPATDPAVTYAQDPAAAPAPAPVPASTSEATVDPTYAAPVASPSTDTYQPSTTTFVDGNGNTGFVPAPAPSPAPTPPVQGATTVTRTIPASTSEAGRSGGDPYYKTFTPSGVLAPVATPPPPPPPFVPRAHQAGYFGPNSQTQQALAGMNSLLNDNRGVTTQDMGQGAQGLANTIMGLGDTTPRTQGMTRIGVGDVGNIPAEIGPLGMVPEPVAGKPYTVPGQQGSFVDVLERGKVSPTTVKTRYRADPVTGEPIEPYVPAGAKAEPNIIPDAPVPAPTAKPASPSPTAPIDGPLTNIKTGRPITNGDRNLLNQAIANNDDVTTMNLVGKTTDELAGLAPAPAAEARPVSSGSSGQPIAGRGFDLTNAADRSQFETMQSLPREDLSKHFSPSQIAQFDNTLPRSAASPVEGPVPAPRPVTPASTTPLPTPVNSRPVGVGNVQREGIPIRGTTRARTAIDGTTPAPTAAPAPGRSTAPSMPEHIQQIKTPSGMEYQAVEAGKTTGPTFKTDKDAASYLARRKVGSTPEVRPAPEAAVPDAVKPNWREAGFRSPEELDAAKARFPTAGKYSGLTKIDPVNPPSFRQRVANDTKQFAGAVPIITGVAGAGVLGFLGAANGTGENLEGLRDRLNTRGPAPEQRRRGPVDGPIADHETMASFLQPIPDYSQVSGNEGTGFRRDSTYDPNFVDVRPTPDIHGIRNTGTPPPPTYRFPGEDRVRAFLDQNQSRFPVTDASGLENAINGAGAGILDAVTDPSGNIVINGYDTGLDTGSRPSLDGVQGALSAVQQRGLPPVSLPGLNLPVPDPRQALDTARRAIQGTPASSLPDFPPGVGSTRTKAAPNVDIFTAKDANGNNMVLGAINEKGEYEAFPQDMTNDAMKQRLDQINAAKNPATAPVASPSTDTSQAPASAPASPPPPPASTATSPPPAATDPASILPLAGPADMATADGESTGTPLKDSNGKETGQTLHDDGTVTNKDGSYAGHYDKSGTYHKSYGSSSYHGSSSSHYSSKHKKKKGSSSFGGPSSGMWDGFPFNRPPSSIRQLVLDAIASSQAKGKSKK